MATQPADIVAVAKQLLAHAEKLQAHLSSNEGKATGLQTQDLPEDLRVARRDVLDAAQEILVSVAGPSEFLELQCINYSVLSCLQWLLQFNILNLMPKNYDPVLYETLAKQAGVPTIALKKASRMTMAAGLLREANPTSIAHSELSLAFAKDIPLQQWAKFVAITGSTTAVAYAESTRRWPDSTAKNQTAYNVAYGTDLSFFEHIKTIPDMAESFAGFMASLRKSDSLKTSHIVNGFDWKSLGDNVHVFDVGGSSGHASVAVAEAFPSFTFTIQDLPEVISSASNAIVKDVPQSIASRISFANQDFFTPQPPLELSDPNKTVVYLFRNVIHDWADENARKILGHIATAMKAQKTGKSKLVILDTILPPPGESSAMTEGIMRIRDLSMVQLFNSKERELVEWEDLFATTEPKLALKSWKLPKGSALAAMEVELA